MTPSSDGFEPLTALPMATDTFGGRASELLDKGTMAGGIALLVDVSARRGTGTIAGIRIDTQVHGEWSERAKLLGLDCATVGQHLFIFYPGNPAEDIPLPPSTHVASAAIPRQFRVRVETTTDVMGNDITYSAEVLLMP